MQQGDTVDWLAERIQDHQRRGRSPFVVGIDGRSGTGKSTVGAQLGDQLGALIIKGDDFYSGGSNEMWDALSPELRVARGIDWRRQKELLDALRHTGRAVWQPYDWEADDGRIVPDAGWLEATDLIVLEGAYSCRSELAAALDLRVLVHLEDGERRRRLVERDGAAYQQDWLARWTSAEDHYFGSIMAPEAFDLVLLR